MPKLPNNAERLEILQGTLDMLILKSLRWGPVHGHGIAHAIERESDDVLKIEHGSLYPAMQRLMQEGWITAEWGTSANNRRARFYRLTRAGKRQLVAERSKWERFTQAIARVMRPARQE
jgi:PadR family transcriptional regulator PadR